MKGDTGRETQANTETGQIEKQRKETEKREKEGGKKKLRREKA